MMRRFHNLPYFKLISKLKVVLVSLVSLSRTPNPTISLLVKLVNHLLLSSNKKPVLFFINLGLNKSYSY